MFEFLFRIFFKLRPKSNFHPNVRNKTINLSNNLPVAHNGSVYPGIHVQENSLTRSMHVPPFAHALLAHSSKSEKEIKIVKNTC